MVDFFPSDRVHLALEDIRGSCCPRSILPLPVSPNVSAWPNLSLTECIRLEVERHRRLQSGNTRRRFHGTIRACCLGDTSLDDTLCRERICNMCRIIQVPPEYLSSLVTLIPLPYRAPSNGPVPVSVQTLVDLERVSIRRRPHPR
jgi:hypothetical protein